MNNKLRQQLSEIRGVDQQDIMRKQMTYLQHYTKRQDFLGGLLDKMDNMDFNSKKERSKFYSSEVVKFDKQNQYI